MQNEFAVIVPVYNSRWIGKCLDSVMCQDYKNFKVVVIDDCSTDDTLEVVKKYPVSYIHNTKHNGSPLANTRRGINTVWNDDVIIVILDGDDWLSAKDVLSYLNEIYQNDVWLTYGQFHPLSGHPKNWCKPVKDTRNYRREEMWYTTALRTFKKWLWDKINPEDLMINGQWAMWASDRAYMYPMIEMAGKHIKCIERVLYIYNDIHANNYKNLSLTEGDKEARYFKLLPSYKEL